MYLGNQPALSYTSFAKQDFTTSATTSYTLSQPVANENEIALFINFVRQEPTTAYTASGTSLTLTSATSASDDMYAIFLGKAVQTVNPPAGSVGISQLSATGTKDSTTFLRGDNTFAQAGLNGWSENGANNNLLPASANAGIYLGVNSATSSNLLDDYEEGTWTATFQGSTHTQTGYYTKIGNLVFVSVYGVNFTTTSSVTAAIGGLPFTSSSSSNAFFAGAVSHNNYCNNGGGNGYFPINNTIFSFILENSTSSASVNVGGGRYVMIAGCYLTN